MNTIENLDIPKIEIIGKGNCVKLESGKTKYIFKLNFALNSDSLWCKIFKSELAILPPGFNHSDFKVEIHEAELHLYCLPVNLENKYKVVKAAVERTNEKYPQHKMEVLKKAASCDAEQRQKEQAQKKQSSEIKSEFERLQI
ncbi:MAG TPA: hypothetical protein VGI63_07145 [Verrucomicrobiae bacterium]|jgi:hypothetical protein